MQNEDRQQGAQTGSAHAPRARGRSLRKNSRRSRFANRATQDQRLLSLKWGRLDTVPELIAIRPRVRESRRTPTCRVVSLRPLLAAGSPWLPRILPNGWPTPRPRLVHTPTLHRCVFIYVGPHRLNQRFAIRFAHLIGHAPGGVPTSATDRLRMFSPIGQIATECSSSATKADLRYSKSGDVRLPNQPRPVWKFRTPMLLPIWLNAASV